MDRSRHDPGERAAKTALVTGITGQDGSYLAELLLAKGYEVHGLIRRASTFNTERLDDIYQDPHDADVRLRLHYGDLHDGVGLINLMPRIQPDEVYHLGAQSHVEVSFEMPDYTGDVTGLGTIRLLEAIRASRHRDALLPGLVLGDVRRDAPAAERDDAVPPAHALRCGQGLRLLGRRSTTARRTACSRSTASCSTTSSRAAARRS